MEKEIKKKLMSKKKMQSNTYMYTTANSYMKYVSKPLKCNAKQKNCIEMNEKRARVHKLATREKESNCIAWNVCFVLFVCVCVYLLTK